MESEYKALTHGAREAVWIRTFWSEIGGRVNPITIHSDSQSAIAVAKNPVHHNQTKHIELKEHFIREVVAMGKVTLSYICSEQQIADSLTKGVSNLKTTFCREKMGILEV
jgi:hypothetical protein